MVMVSTFSFCCCCEGVCVGGGGGGRKEGHENVTSYDRLVGGRENRLCCGSHSLFSLFNFVPHQHPSIDVCFSLTLTHAQTRQSIPVKSVGYHYQMPSIGKLILAISRMERMLLDRPMVLLTLVRLTLLVLPLKLPRLPRRLEHYRT